VFGIIRIAKLIYGKLPDNRRQSGCVAKSPAGGASKHTIARLVRVLAPVTIVVAMISNYEHALAARWIAQKDD